MKRTNVIKRGGTVMQCFFCRNTVRTDSDVVSVLCGTCTAKISDPAARPVQPSMTADVKAAKEAKRVEKQAARATREVTIKHRGRGRGWHLKRAVEFDGQWYSFGKPITAELAKTIMKVG